MLYCLSSQLNLLRLKMDSDFILRQDTEEGFTQDTIVYIMNFNQYDHSINYTLDTVYILTSAQRKTPYGSNEVYFCQEYTISV